MPSTGFPEKIGVSSTGFERRKGFEKKKPYTALFEHSEINATQHNI